MFENLKTENYIGGISGGLVAYFGIRKFRPNTNVYLHWGATALAVWVGSKYVAPQVAKLFQGGEEVAPVE
jgi:hypothetical protein